MKIQLFENSKQVYKRSNFTEKSLRSLEYLSKRSKVLHFENLGDLFSLSTTSYCGLLQVTEELEVSIIPKIYSPENDPCLNLVLFSISQFETQNMGCDVH